MRKIEHDVYRVRAEQWALTQFQKIYMKFYMDEFSRRVKKGITAAKARKIKN